MPWLREQRHQFVIPAFVLIAHETVHRGGNQFQFFGRRVAVGADIAGTVLDFLQKAGDADFHELIEVVRGDGQKLHALQQRIAADRGLLPERAG